MCFVTLLRSNPPDDYTSDLYEPSICAHQFDIDDQDQAFADVWWQLTDRQGLSDLVNQTLGLDIDQLLVGQIDVPFPCKHVLRPKIGALY